jgi:hypothetical protein
MLKRTVGTAVSLLLTLAATLVLAPAARADSQVRIVRLSLVEGDVQIDRSGQGFEKAIMNMPITQGMQISTDEDARAEVEFEDGTTLRLAPRTQIAFSQLGLRTSGARISTVQVEQGTAYFNVRHKGDDDFRVTFANREIQIERNVHFRLDLTGSTPELAVFKGELEINGPQGHAKVKKDQTLTFDVADEKDFEIAKNITPLSYDAWDKDRLEYASQYASNSNSRSPYYYGNSDLNYYGSWSSWPGYGMMWRPFGVGYGWDPFYNGAWAWYPGFGYTWVSTYPWGWTPYRYGSWVFVANHGWGWRPGGWRTWYTVPPVHNPPPFFHGPKPPPAATHVGAGPVVRHPTVVVDNGVGIIRGPNLKNVPPHQGFVPGRTGVNAGTPTVVPPAQGTPARTMAPAPGTGIAAPGSPMPIRNGRSEMRGRWAGKDQPMRVSPDNGRAPAPRVEHSTPPPHVERTAPAPRMERSAPAPRMERSAPAPRPSGPPSGGRIGGGKSSKQ